MSCLKILNKIEKSTLAFPRSIRFMVIFVSHSFSRLNTKLMCHIFTFACDTKSFANAFVFSVCVLTHTTLQLTFFFFSSAVFFGRTGKSYLYFSSTAALGACDHIGLINICLCFHAMCFRITE